LKSHPVIGAKDRGRNAAAFFDKNLRAAQPSGPIYSRAV